MAVKRLLLGVCLLAGTSNGCGGGEDVPLVVTESAAPTTGLSPLRPEAARSGDSDEKEEDAADEAGGEATELEPAFCDPAECPEMLLFGVFAPGCCRFGNLCGGRVQVSERTWACLAPEVNEQGEVLRSALTRAAREPFVPAAECPGQIIDGDELEGCCRGGVCGLDTQPWTSAAATLGLVLPRACLDPREAAELAKQPVSNTPPPRCRD